MYLGTDVHLEGYQRRLRGRFQCWTGDRGNRLNRDFRRFICQNTIYGPAPDIRRYRTPNWLFESFVYIVSGSHYIDSSVHDENADSGFTPPLVGENPSSRVLWDDVNLIHPITIVSYWVLFWTCVNCCWPRSTILDKFSPPEANRLKVPKWIYGTEK